MKAQKPDLLIIIGGLVFFVVGVGYLVLYLIGANYNENLSLTPQAQLTVLPAFGIPTIDNSFLVIFPTSTPTLNPVSGEKFPINSYVQISGTGGNGLRIRENPGTESDVNFIASESEVFKVIGGPIQTGNYSWWQLTAPYDELRQGWAAGEYLISVIP